MSDYARALLAAIREEDDEPLLHPREDAESPPAPLVARGDSLLDEGEGARLDSALPNVDADRWTQFARCMMTQPLSAVSASNGLGLFDIRPRRLADLGVVVRLARKESPAGRLVWVAAFVPPLTCSGFLNSPYAQYAVFCRSIRDFAKRIDSGEIAKEPDMSLSEALAVLHKCGPSGLKTWATSERFPETEKVVSRVAGVF